ncbi:cell wall assembly protein [Paenibacillus stellifer]|uniref:Cell wall assembly protein n=1 Tax=Paenibacillus stellifer TaxID=169760 RepID=A0A089LYX5_9BACL|nr:SMI1/KNR4 family protein [Paenibacillus stellifer]AIQ66122.1 cell wall assembly protein [Paenibacillus stellifer]
MQDNLLDQLETWHEEDEFDQIVEAIMEIPEEDRDYALNSHLGRAMNNLKRYDEAIAIFKKIEQEGQDDPLWQYRIGIAYYYTEQFGKAKRAFKAADRLAPDDEDTLEFLEALEDTEDEEPEEPKAKKQKPVQAPPAKRKALPVNTDTALDLADFWEDSEQADEQYRLDPPTDEQIASVEDELVFKLPAFYIQMMKEHNGGVPRKRYFPVGDPDSSEYIEVTGLLGIGRDKSHSLCGERGSRARVIHEDYPEFGVIIGECPDENEVVMLDYRPSGNDGEPEVIHVAKENGNKITYLAPSFEAFVRGLKDSAEASPNE